MELFTFDAEYVRNLRSHDRDTAEHFALYFGAVLGVKLRRRGYPAHVVDDLRQETFARVIERLDRLRNPSSLGAFVISVANAVLREHQREHRYESLPDDIDQLLAVPATEVVELDTKVLRAIERMSIRRTFGSIVVPADRPLPATNILLTRLALPSSFEKRVISAESLPLSIIRRVANDPHVMHQLSPRQFEEFIATLIDELGFDDVLLTPPSRDGGRDLIARHTVHGIPITFFFECKKYAGGSLVQLDTLRALLGVVAHESRSANIGVLVTTSRFTRGCKELIASEARLDGKDYDGITKWVSDWAALPKRAN
jgi:HJR/Mrr/RecB family endonuclease